MMAHMRLLFFNASRMLAIVCYANKPHHQPQMGEIARGVRAKAKKISQRMKMVEVWCHHESTTLQLQMPCQQPLHHLTTTGNACDLKKQGQGC
jgi:hypothetical protein